MAFTSTSTNLVAGDTNSVQDIFVHDRQTGSTTRVSVGPGGAQANGASAGQSISGDGRFVAFQSAATNLVAGDTNGLADCFVHDRQTGVTTRVSVATGGAQATGGPNFITAISANGRFVAFYSSATNLVAGDTNGLQDVFRHDRQTGTTVRVSVATGGAQAAGQGSFGPFISSDGRFVGFYSGATNLVPGDTNGVSDVFIHDVQTATTSRVSLGPGGTQANAESLVGSFSNDGRFVCFESFATNLEPGGGIGAFIHDRQTGVTSPVAVVPSSAAAQKPTEPKISGNGRFVIFGTLEALAPDDTNGQGDVYLRDLQTTTTTRVSVATGGGQGNAFSGTGAINQNGSVIAFPSSSTNLVSGDTNGAWDIFVRNIPGNGSGTLPTMTLDKTSLRFAAVTNGAAFLAQTAAQVVRLTQSGAGTVAWTATSNQPWLQVSPASGTGSANLSLSVASAGGLAAGATVNGAITLVLTGAFGGAGPVNVALTVYANGTTVGPFGNVDTPVNNVTGITGAVPFTGWALDDIEVQRVTVCRSAFGAEVAPVDPNCGGTAQIFVGVAVFIDGARPDVAAAYPAFPVNTRGGWGFMVLTNTLPSQGNGTFVFHMWAQDRDGHTIVLGTRTMTCANASSILPFGAIDTPTQGGVASGAFNVFGWVLSRTNRADPPGGGTVIVQVDGVTVGSPGGWTSRARSHGALPRFPGHQHRARRIWVEHDVADKRPAHDSMGRDRQHGPRRRDRESVLHGVERRRGDDRGGGHGGNDRSGRSVRAGGAPGHQRGGHCRRPAGQRRHRRSPRMGPGRALCVVCRGRLGARRRPERGGQSGRVAAGTGRALHRPPPYERRTQSVTDRVAFGCDDGRLHVGAGRGVCGGLRSGVRPLGRCRSGGAARSADHPRSEGKPPGRPAGGDRFAAVAAGRRAAVPPWRLGGGSQCGERHRDRDAARLGVSADGWTAGVPGRDKLRRRTT